MPASRTRAVAIVASVRVPAWDDLQERRQLQSRLLNAREDAEAAPGRIYVVPTGCWGYGTPGVGELRHPRRRLAGTTSKFAIPGGMASGRSSPAFDRVVERRRAVAMARHFREAEGLSNAQIAVRLGRSPATIKAYFYDPSDANKGPS